jgi:hypothetical protein
MGDSELERLIKGEKELFNIIDFCTGAVRAFGGEYFHENQGLNSYRNPEIKKRLSGYHGFDMDLDHGFSGAYGEWDKLTLSHKGHIVLDVEYASRLEYKVNFSEDGVWRVAMNNLLKQKGLIEKDKIAYARKKAREDALEQRRKALAKEEDDQRIKVEKLRKSLNDFV